MDKNFNLVYESRSGELVKARMIRDKKLIELEDGTTWEYNKIAFNYRFIGNRSGSFPSKKYVTERNINGFAIRKKVSA